jgi:hypothetical protein
MQDNIHGDRIQDNEDSYDHLIVTIEASQGVLSLLIACCDDRPFRDSIIRRYERELTPAIPHYRAQLSYEKPSLRSALAQVVAEHPELKAGTDAAITVTGAEDLLTVALGENPTRTEVEQFFGYLQWTREGLRAFPYPIVLWVTSKILEQMSFAAPDFWSWRSGVFRFVATQALTQISTPTLQVDELSQIESEVVESLPVDELLFSVRQLEQEQGDRSPALATLYDRLGQAYRSRVKTKQAENIPQETELAIEYFQKAIALQTELGDILNLANTLNRLGRFYQNLGRYERAISLYKRSLEISGQIGNQQGKVISLSSLGNDSE